MHLHTRSTLRRVKSKCIFAHGQTLHRVKSGSILANQKGIEPFNLVNSPPGQVEDVSSYMSTLCHVKLGPCPQCPINSLSVPSGSGPQCLCTVPALYPNHVTPVLLYCITSALDGYVMPRAAAHPWMMMSQVYGKQ